MTAPEPPTGVTIHTLTGDHSAEITYAGVRKDGLHVWHADTALPLAEAVSITVNTLPPKTIVMLPVKAPA